MTISNLTATILRQRNPKLKLRGFRHDFLRFMFDRKRHLIGTEIYDGEEGLEKITKEGIKEEINQNYRADLRFIPDAYSIDGNDICLYEIEDTNKLSERKLKMLCDLWFTIDSVDPDVTFRVFVCDRYGNNMHKIDLFEYWYAIQDRMHKMRPVDEVREMLDV